MALATLFTPKYEFALIAAVSSPRHLSLSLCPPRTRHKRRFLPLFQRCLSQSASEQWTIAKREGGKSVLVKLLIVIVTIDTVGSQMLLKRALQQIGSPATLSAFPAFLLSAAQSPWVYASLVLQIVGYVMWLVVISKEKLGIAVAISGAVFYVLVASAAWILYDERLATIQWVGLGLITAGVICVGASRA